MNPSSSSPEFDSVKVVLAIAVIVTLGYFAFKYLHTNALGGKGQVANQSQQKVTQLGTVSMVTTLGATQVTATSALLNGMGPKTNDSLTPVFVYGASMKYGSTMTPIGITGTISAPVTGLTCHTTYHYKMTAKSGALTSSGKDMTFTTGACTTLPTKHVAQ